MHLKDAHELKENTNRQLNKIKALMQGQNETIEKRPEL